MKLVSAIVAFVLLIGGPAATFASDAPTGPISEVGSKIDPLTPVPPPACPPTPTYSFCDSLKHQIDVYNHYAGMLNQIKTMQRDALQYMRYPQKVQGYLQDDLNKAATIVEQGRGLNFLSKNVDQEVQKMWPDWHPGFNPTDLDTFLETRLERSIATVLKANQGQTADATRDTDLVEQIKDAAAHSTSATQTGQMTVQLLGVMYQQMVRQQQAVGLKASMEAAYDLQQAGQARVQRQVSEAAARSQMQRLYPVPPQLTSAQMNAILSTRYP